MMSAVIAENKPFVNQRASIVKQGIELIGIINKRGRLVDSIGSDSIDMPKEKKDMFFMKIALRNSMQRDFDEDLGSVDYSITKRRGAKYISIPIGGGNTILAITKKEVDHENVVAGINQMIQHSKEFLGIKISKEEEDSN